MVTEFDTLDDYSFYWCTYNIYNSSKGTQCDNWHLPKCNAHVCEANRKWIVKIWSITWARQAVSQSVSGVPCGKHNKQGRKNRNVIHSPHEYYNGIAQSVGSACKRAIKFRMWNESHSRNRQKENFNPHRTTIHHRPPYQLKHIQIWHVHCKRSTFTNLFSIHR